MKAAEKEVIQAGHSDRFVALLIVDSEPADSSSIVVVDVPKEFSYGKVAEAELAVGSTNETATVAGDFAQIERAVELGIVLVERHSLCQLIDAQWTFG